MLRVVDTARLKDYGFVETKGLGGYKYWIRHLGAVESDESCDNVDVTLCVVNKMCNDYQAYELKVEVDVDPSAFSQYAVAEIEVLAKMLADGVCVISKEDRTEVA